MSKNETEKWDNDPDVFFANASSVLRSYLIPGGVYHLKMRFWQKRISSDDRLLIIHRAWSILETFIGLPFWEAACLSHLIDAGSEKVLWHGTIFEGAVCADLLERLKRSGHSGLKSALYNRYFLLSEMQLHKMYQLVDLEATDMLNQMLHAAKELRGAPFPQLSEQPPEV